MAGLPDDGLPRIVILVDSDGLDVRANGYRLRDGR